ncbi:MAG: hypothetical protein GY862_05120 [Gammaproteobacteria bacterium]|nr:hypothetical protein [Gammaproteobacteria bacterium]
MLQTVEATIDSQGNLRFSENVTLHASQRVLVTFLKHAPVMRSEQNYAQLMRRLAYVKAGKRFSRDELNER